METIAIDDVFNKRIVLPDSDADERLARLVGMEEPIERLSSLLDWLLFPKRFNEWKKLYHLHASVIFDYVKNRHPLVIIGGDVGTGKTELSETIGSRVARNSKLEITLFPMSLSTRGSGLVGEMSKLISSAFHHIERECENINKVKGTYQSGIIMLLDEADALAQSREEVQMHHEDRAGVNALIRGIDSLNNRQFPVAIIMCTNRLAALDPAITRRAAEVFSFQRPNKAMRQQILHSALQEINFTDHQIDKLVELTGKQGELKYGFTFSDITQRLFHAIVMSAYPNSAISYENSHAAIQKIKPTPPFRDNT